MPGARLTRARASPELGWISGAIESPARRTTPGTWSPASAGLRLQEDMKPSNISRLTSGLCIVIFTGCAAADQDPEPAMTSTDNGTTAPAGDSSSSSNVTTELTTDAASSSSTSTASDPDGSDTMGSVFDVGNIADMGGDCVPTSRVEMTCDDLDDDCNGLVDDVDEGLDGICDCLAIALVGIPGANSSSSFEQWLTDQGTSTVRINPVLIDAATLAPYDIIILDRQTRGYSALEAAAFEAWVGNGGGLMAMSGYGFSVDTNQEWPNGILGSFGLSYSGTVLNGPVTDFAVHPITDGLSSVTFLGGYTVDEAMAGSTQLIGRIGTTTVARARSFGDGKVFVWGDEWIQFDSEWSTMPEIEMFWANTLTWLSPPSVCPTPEG
ncbi:MAG: hypothetical protein AB1Z98_09285 [Nannocystaceae bacterium]